MNFNLSANKMFIALNIPQEIFETKIFEKRKVVNDTMMNDALINVACREEVIVN